MHDLRALVVDDSKVGRLTIMKKLEALGVTVALAESGQQALYYLVQQRPDLIFMDHMMPEMDGFEVTRRIKASPDTSDIPVIIISGNDDAEFLREARAAGAIDAIAKPPAAGVLEALLASLPKSPVEAAVAAPIPQPAVEPAPSLDMAAVHALLERLVGTAVTPLHDDLMAELGQRLAVESSNQRKTLAEWSERLDQQVADQAELKRGLADAAALGDRMQSLEQRLLSLEAAAGGPQPDFAALQANMDQRGEARLIQLRAELQTELQARVDDHAAAMEQTATGWGSRLDAFAETLDQVARDMQSMRSGQAESLQSLEQRVEQQLAQMQDAASAAMQEAAVPVAVVASGESQAMQAVLSMQAELGELREQMSEARLRQWVAEAVGSLQPPAEVERVVAESAAPPVAIPNQSAELARLQGKVKTLSVITAAGGVLLLAVLGMLVFGG
jgi:CheY-like chemotaxis protein